MVCTTCETVERSMPVPVDDVLLAGAVLVGCGDEDDVLARRKVNARPFPYGRARRRIGARGAADAAATGPTVNYES